MRPVTWAAWRVTSQPPCSRSGSQTPAGWPASAAAAALHTCCQPGVPLSAHTLARPQQALQLLMVELHQGYRVQRPPCPRAPAWVPCLWVLPEPLQAGPQATWHQSWDPPPQAHPRPCSGAPSAGRAPSPTLYCCRTVARMSVVLLRRTSPGATGCHQRRGWSFLRGCMGVWSRTR